MALTLADQYYLKALDDYDYDLEVVVENLGYALGYDSEHAGANHLMGKLYMEKFRKFDLAEEYFIASLASEPSNVDACESYSRLLIRTGKFPEALKLIRYASGLSGAVISKFLQLEALVHELQKDFGKAKELLQAAVLESYDSHYIYFLNQEIDRVEKKMCLSGEVNYDFTG